MDKSLYKTIKGLNFSKIKEMNKLNSKIIKKLLNSINKDSDLFNMNAHLKLNL